MPATFSVLWYVAGDGVVLPAGLTELILNCGIFCGDDIQQHMASSPLEYLQLRWVGT